MKQIAGLADRLKGHSFFQDGWIVSLIFINLLVIAFAVFWSVTHIRQTDLAIPVRYTSLQNFELGQWYELYELVLIPILAFITNILLSIGTYHKSRLISIFLVFVSTIIAILATTILIGFTAINYGTS